MQMMFNFLGSFVFFNIFWRFDIEVVVDCVLEIGYAACGPEKVCAINSNRWIAIRPMTDTSSVRSLIVRKIFGMEVLAIVTEMVFAEIFVFFWVGCFVVKHIFV